MKNKIRLKRGTGIALLLCVLLTGGGCADVFVPMEAERSYIAEEAGEAENTSRESAAEDEPAEERTSEAPGTTGEIYVHVCGCVRDPGLYMFSSGVRAGDAIAQAGGFTKKANQDAVNLASILSDGTQLYVPAKEEGASGAGGTALSGTPAADPDSSPDEAVVNINTAGAEELMTLSGIGEARAEAILSYREESGDFSSIEDIKNVTGIGDGIFERIKNRITV